MGMTRDRGSNRLLATIAAAISAGVAAAGPGDRPGAIHSSDWWFEQAVREIDAIDGPVDQSLSCGDIALAHARLGDLAAAEETAELLAGIEGRRTAYGVVRLTEIRDTVLTITAVARARGGDLEGAEARLREIEGELASANARVQIIRTLAEGARIAEARELLETLEGETAIRKSMAAIAVGLANLDRIDEAQAVLDESLRGTYSGDQVIVALANAYARAGQYERAEAALAEIVDEQLQIEAIMVIASQRAYHGDSEGATDFADRRESRKRQAMALRAIGEAEFASGQVSHAWATLADAHLAAERIGDLQDRWRCCLEVGRTRRQVGDREGALASLAAALDALIPMGEPERPSEGAPPPARITVSTARAVSLAVIAAEQARAGEQWLAAATMTYVGGGAIRDQALLLYVEGLSDALALGMAERAARRIRNRQPRCAALQAIAMAAASSPGGDLEELREWMRSMADPAARVAVCVGAAEGVARRPRPAPVQASR